MKRKIDAKKILIISSILIILIGVVLLIVLKPKKKTNNNNENKKKTTVKKEVPKEKVDIVNLESKTRPFAVSINNTPVAIKVQQGLNKAYMIYEVPTEGSTSRLLAFFKDTDDVTIGTVRSARHNFIDIAMESDAIFVAYGWSSHAQRQLQQLHAIDYINGMIHSKPYWRNNPEHLASEHTAYTSISKIQDFAYNSMKYKKESSSADNTVLLNYNVKDVDLSSKEGSIDANEVKIPYGSVTTEFKYNPETKMYTRVVNGTTTTDHETKEEFTTKNIIVQKITYQRTADNYYWDLNLIGSGEGYYVTNGKAVPIKWSKSGRSNKTKYTYTDGSEIEVSDGRTYIEIYVTNASIN